ncbi:alkene reductase [Algoriphagus aestuariicola]|jgi:N-ethylmaleimide reductase|uniref:Alkene reductase n=1 Tax=Algoriphagus aestuariicola TaxID=1852016 RepID=A0ABS3BZW4_9BACT|nr:alkene reductase [Algoriphagus aestuariicola]MBN7803264.1 alkene reductase [Algoriphagus aestuariicola]
MKLLTPTTIGDLQLKNRMVMAAMTRSRAPEDGLVQEMTATYYAQRSSAGLILSEATNISKDAIGSPFTPGLYTSGQVEAWKKVTETVHDEGGLIFAQLWHTGRVGHSVDRSNKLPLAPSAIAIEGQRHFTSEGMKDFETPREMSLEDIRQTILDYRQAALYAIEAGFDGVELHGANGYLPNQFLADSSNHRKDQYGGSVENRCRFMLEALETICEAIGSSKVGVKLSPLGTNNGIQLEDPVGTFSYLIEKINGLDLAFIELARRSPDADLLPRYPIENDVALFGDLVKTSLIANANYDRESGEKELIKGKADAISYARLFLANPDLPKRFELDADLNEADPKTMYGGTEKGYIDYPLLNQKVEV